MGQRITTSGLKGLVAQATLFNPDTLSTSSSYTQAGPHGGGVGVPAPPTGSEAPVLASIEGIGDQDNPCVIEVLRAGNPGLDSQAMRVGYRLASESSTQVRGWTPPDVITDVVQIDGTNGGDTDSLDVAVAPDGIVKILIRTGGATDVMWTAAYTPSTEAVAGLSANGPLASGESTLEGGCIAYDGDGILHWIQQDANNVWRMWRENPDSGWDLVAYDPFDINPGAAPNKLRLLILPSGEWGLIEITDAGANLTVTQWASSNRGGSWTRIATDTTTWQGMGDACVTPGGRMALVVVDGTQPNYYSVASPWENLLTVTAVAVTDTITTDEAWITADPVGRLYCIIRYSGGSTMDTLFSDDEGATWTSNSAAHFLDLQADADPYVTGGRACFSSGSLMLVYQASDSITTADEWVRLMRLGGWENAQLLACGSGGNTSITNAVTWINISEPGSQVGWTVGGAGTDTLSSTLGMTVATTNAGAQTRSYTAATVPATSATAQLTAGAKIKIGAASTGAITAHHHGFALRVSDGAVASGLGIYCSTTQFAVVDHTGANLATVTADMDGTWVYFLVHCKLGAEGAVYYRTVGSNTWILAYESATLGTTAVATGEVVWGNRTTPGSGTATSSWQYFWYARSSALTDDIPIHSRLVASAQQRGLSGKQVTTNASPLGDGMIASGGDKLLHIRATDGPGVLGDTFTITPRYDHPITAIIPTVSPSPRNTWRSTSTAENTIQFDLDPTYDTSLGRSIGLCLMNVNFPTAYLEAYNGATWDTVGTWNGVMSLGKYARTGNVIRNTDSVIAPSYIYRNQYVGAALSLGSSKYRKIRSHTEGTYGARGPGKHVEFTLDGVDGTEPATGTSLAVWARSGCLVVHNVATHYRQWRLRVPSQSNADGYHQIGIALIGPLITAGQQFSRGGTASYERNATQEETRDLVSRVKRLGPVRKSWTWPYTDPMDQTQLRTPSPSPDFLDSDSSTGEALANFRDVPYLYAGLLEELQSGEVPVCALNPVPGTSGVTVTDPTQFLYGRIASDIGVDHVLGDEGKNEVLRMGPVTFREIP